MFTKFHIALVNPRWYRDGVSLTDVANEPAFNMHGNIEDTHIVSQLMNSLNDIWREYAQVKCCQFFQKQAVKLEQICSLLAAELDHLPCISPVKLW